MIATTFELGVGSADAGAGASCSPFERADVFFEPAATVLSAWADLESSAPCSVYQTRAFTLPWVETLGRKAHLEPLFVVARDRDGQATALLSLGIAKRGPFRVATWLGGKDANFNMALLRRPSAWSRGDLSRLLREAARACGRRAPHAFDLPNQPFAWSGSNNPFSELPHSESPSAAYGTDLPDNAEILFTTKLSKDTRKKLRKKEAKLATFGALLHRVATQRNEQVTILDAFLEQKTKRFRARGVASEFDAPEMRAFIEAASAPNGTGIELHALYAGERIVAVYGGAAHGGQWSGMFNSFDADEEIAKTSPGDLLLMRIMASCCAAGVARFDLGIGEARYKAALCDEAIALFDTIVPVDAYGRGYVALAGARQSIKRRIKRDPRLMAIVARARALRS